MLRVGYCIVVSVFVFFYICENSIAECLPDDENDVKMRVQSRMRETFGTACPTINANGLKFQYFTSFMNGKDKLTAEQHFTVESKAKRQNNCLYIYSRKLLTDARLGAGPNCSTYRVFKAGWFPNADGGPAFMFYMRRK